MAPRVLSIYSSTPETREGASPIPMTKSTGVRLQAKRERERLRAERPYRLPNPLAKHGGHFGRTVDAFCHVEKLLQGGAVYLRKLGDPSETFTKKELQEAWTFQQLEDAVPRFEAQVMASSETELNEMGERIRSGFNRTRSNDTNKFKGEILCWIGRPGEPLDPTLRRDVKTNRGFRSDSTGRLLCPSHMDWSDPRVRNQLRSRGILLHDGELPIFLWAGYQYDSENFWKGLLRSTILVWAFKFVFTSPSSVKGKTKRTRASNSRIHGMTCVTPASIVYIAMQVYFALSSSEVFSSTASYQSYPSVRPCEEEIFYKSLLDLLYNEEESTEVADLLTWWDQQIFGSRGDSGERAAPAREEAALAKIQEKRLTLQTILAVASQA
ncbi:hypothetical protein OF83DRAFT_1125473 [Amylostereum chailletii]|nr:hypothetical protein OF83DRAFT_1125473 [Amylostereum chailletii]